MSDQDDIDDNDYYGNHTPYQAPENIEQMAIYTALRSLVFFGSNVNLNNQAMNLTIVDEFIMDLEYGYLRSKCDESNTPYQVIFLSAQSQMWVFSAYELMRTWREKISKYLKAAKNGGLPLMLKELQKPRDYENYETQRRIDEVTFLINNPKLVEALQNELKRTQILFTQMELLRMSLAKHQMRKKPNAHVLTPTVGYMNRFCGSLEFQINSGQVIIQNISRRDIADGIRAIPTSTAPSDEYLASFEAAMRGPSDD
ncbi:hypothetical protein ACSEQC_24795 [Pseudomonas aeruginosa]|uniref:hypothetical protein n=1 Tax=Pseudomonas aeruginosa group TaxID=136841 RepID=UPI000D45214D|nr:MULTISPECIES: hypothetical protein [Pseudomonas aeruginosa group]MCV3977803.1 hypothetical protein [Pseudomonas aeruginosa]MDP5407224.1 hypothetical protein [Pseudomonas aeruginosa]PTC33707.1 hypothetical protein CLJ1_5817 [Pseudomonas aeruginosa]